MSTSRVIRILLLLASLLNNTRNFVLAGARTAIRRWSMQGTPFGTRCGTKSILRATQPGLSSRRYALRRPLCLSLSKSTKVLVHLLPPTLRYPLMHLDPFHLFLPLQRVSACCAIGQCLVPRSLSKSTPTVVVGYFSRVVATRTPLFLPCTPPLKAPPRSPPAFTSPRPTLPRSPFLGHPLLCHRAWTLVSMRRLVAIIPIRRGGTIQTPITHPHTPPPCHPLMRAWWV